MVTDIRSFMGVRLREERERLELSQQQMAALAEFKLRTYQDWERGIAAVSSEFLALAAPRGLDVFYVLTGERMSSKLSLDPIQSAVLGSLAQCSPQRQMEAVQHMALLAAGMTPALPPASVGNAAASSSASKARVKKPAGGVPSTKPRKAR
jgi:transcriptional regulator with XRE-family HTH domain